MILLDSNVISALAQGARLATRNGRHFDDTTIALINPFTA